MPSQCAKKSLALTHDSDECASSPVQNNTADRSFRAIDALHAHSKSLQHGDKHQDTSSIWDWFNASGRTSDHGSEKTILEKK